VIALKEESVIKNDLTRRWVDPQTVFSEDVITLKTVEILSLHLNLGSDYPNGGVHRPFII